MMQNPAKQSWKNMFLARSIKWNWDENKEFIVLLDDKKILLDKWQTFIFLMADGSRTFENIVDYLPTQYRDKSLIPENINGLLLKASHALIDDLGAISLREISDSLDEEYLLPENGVGSF